MLSRSRASALAAFGVLALTGVAIAVDGSAGAIATPTTYTASGTFDVPADVCSITVEVIGAQGGDGDFDNALGTGALGARVSATVAVTPGESLTVVVGGAGGDATATAAGAAGTPGG